MSDKPYVTVGVQTGDVPSAEATAPHTRAMRNLLQSHCRGPYSSEVDELSLVIRVDGDIWHWEKEGCDRMRRSKKERYITIDIYVPRNRWEGVDGIEIRNYLAACVEDAFRRMIGKLQRDEVPVNGQALMDDFDIARKKYLEQIESSASP